MGRPAACHCLIGPNNRQKRRSTTGTNRVDDTPKKARHTERAKAQPTARPPKSPTRSTPSSFFLYFFPLSRKGAGVCEDRTRLPIFFRRKRRAALDSTNKTKPRIQQGPTACHNFLRKRPSHFGWRKTILRGGGVYEAGQRAIEKGSAGWRPSCLACRRQTARRGNANRARDQEKHPLPSSKTHQKKKRNDNVNDRDRRQRQEQRSKVKIGSFFRPCAPCNCLPLTRLRRCL